jgi:hypothetical protein
MKLYLALILALILTGCATTDDSGLTAHDAHEAYLHSAQVLSVTPADLVPTRSAITRAKKAHRKLHLRCASCGVKGNVVNGNRNDVHHIVPEHVDIAQAATPSNLITLCRNCHFVHGHCGNWKKYNVEISQAAIDLLLVGEYWKERGEVE